MKMFWRLGLIASWGFSSLEVCAGDVSDARTQTLAEELLEVETQARKGVPAEATMLLKRVLADAVLAAQRVAQHPPRTREDALAVMAAIQEALANHHFAQPSLEKDWPDTMGQALKLRGTAPPLYYVDCDMGAQLFVSVGQRLGWDIRLVEASEKHLFIRWHLSSAEEVNWDWSDAMSLDDQVYWERNAGETSQARVLYMRSFSLDEARAYYVGLIASHADTASTAERLFAQAQPLQGGHPRFLNNLGWFYATHPDVPDDNRGLGVRYALAGWSFKPRNPNNIDTVACAFAASGEWERAEAYEDAALKLRPLDKSYLRNRELIGRGQRCVN